MGLGNFFVYILIIYEVNIFYKLLFSRRLRQDVKEKNIELEKLRSVTVKTLEQQKRFVDLCYPRKPKFVWSFESVIIPILYIVLFICFSILFSKLTFYLKIDIGLWTGLMLLMFVPVVVNFVLRKFNLNTHNPLNHMFRFKKSKKFK